MKRTTIHDVAREAGVSITTVSHALNGHPVVNENTRQRVIEVATRLQYAPDVNARSMGGRTSIAIALLVSDLSPKDESGLVFGVLCGLHNICAKYNCELILLSTSTLEQESMSYLQLCRSKNINGVVVMGLTTDDPYYQQILKSEIPCVIVDAEVAGKNISSVSIDNMKASFDAVQWLIDHVHTQIAMINGKINAWVINDRFSGYASALINNNIPVNLEYVVHADFDENLAYTKTKELLSKHPQITALFCASDLMAIGSLRACMELNLNVPEDIAIIGFDDIPAAKYVHGGLSTISQDPYTMGRLAGEGVYNMFQGKEVSPRIFAPYELVIRKTT